jgi:MFS family permease
VVLAAVIYFTVREVPRGSAEPEFQELDSTDRYHIDWSTVRGLSRNRTLLLLMAQGFFGVLPWNVLVYWFFCYLETERGYTPGQATTSMLIAIVTLSAGYLVGGTLGDTLFKRMQRGRLLVATGGVLLGAVFLAGTLNVAAENRTGFAVLLAFTGMTMSVAAPNVIATVYDTTVPEVRSTARAMQKLVEDGGAALAPFLAGVIAMRTSLHAAILVICISAWLICAVLFGVTAFVVPRDIEQLRQTMQRRVEEMASNGA